MALSAIVISASAAVGNISGQTSKYSQPIYVGSVESGATLTQIRIPGSSSYGISGASDSVISAVEVPPGSSKISLEVLNCGTYNYSKTTMGAAALKYNNAHSGETVVAAMNGDPWIMYHTDYDGDGNASTGASVPHVSVPRGLMVIDGEIWNTQYCDDENNLAKTNNAERGTPAAKQVAFCVLADGTYVIGAPEVKVSFANASTGATFTAAGINRLPAPNSIIVYNHRGGSSTQAYEDAYEVYITTSNSAFGFGKTTTGTVSAIYASGTAVSSRAGVDANTIVISARGSAINTIKGKFSVGQKVNFTNTVTADHSGHTSANLGVWNNVRDAIGGFYELLKNGTLMGELSNSTAYPAPIIGIKADGTAVMATVTSTVDGTRNATRMKYLPYIAKELGMLNCIMFDGGGSAQMVTLEGSEYVRRASCADGSNSVRTVISGVAAVYHGADLTVTNKETSAQKLITSNIASTTPVETTYYNVSAIDTMNGVSDGSFAKPGQPVVTTLKGSLTNNKLALKGWSIVNGGTNGDIYYSVDGGTNWKTTSGTYSTAEQAVLDSAKSNSTFTNVSGTKGRFEITADLSAYQGQTVDVRFARKSVSGSMSHFLTVENVTVGSSGSGSGSGSGGSTTSGGISAAFGYYATVESINGTLTNLVGMRDPSYSSSASDKTVFIKPAIATGFSAPSKSLSVSGWAVVNGSNSGKFYWSVDKVNWTECTGTTVSATTDANCTTAKNSGALTSAATAKGAFSGATADLSAYDGQTVDVYFATVGTLAGYEASYLHFLTVEDVYVGQQSGGDSGDVATKGQNSGSIDYFNSTNVTGYRAKPGKPISTVLPVPMSSSLLTIQGWCVAEGGYNGGIVYSLDGGKTWHNTSGTYEENPGDGDAIVDLAKKDGLTTVSKTNCRFSVGVDLSAYKGQTVTVTFGINSSSSSQQISTFATITDVTVPSATFQNAVIALDKINGVANTSIGGSTAQSGVFQVTVPAGCEMTSTTFSIKGWAVVNGGQVNNGIHFSVDGGATWIAGTGATYNSTADNGITSALNTNASAWGLTSYNSVYSRFTDVSVDLSARAGMKTNITVGIMQTDGTIRPIMTFVGVSVPGNHVCTAGSTVASLGNGTHVYTCTGCGNSMNAVACTSNGTYTSTGNGTHTSVCTVCGGKTAAEVCTGGSTWANDGTSHWKNCSKCSTKISTTVAAHTGTATCQSAATCTVCNKSFGSVGSHTLVEIEGKDPTCTESGLSAGEKCSVCGTVTVAQTTLAAYGHHETELPAIAATCESTGLTAGVKCFTCNTILTAQTVTQKVAHNYVGGVCSMCGKADTTSCSHTYDDKCATECNKCGEVRVAPHADRIAMGAAVDATCTQNGYSEGYICSGCGEILTEPTMTPVLGHKNDVTIKGYAATCAQSGLTDGVKCSRCDEVTTPQTVIPAKGHTEVEVPGFAATCKEAGLTDGVICSVCNNVIVEQTEIAKVAHTEQNVAGKAATCLEAGLTDGKICSVCQTVIVEQTVINALGHTEVDVPGYAATCTAEGLTDGKRCTVCDTVTKAQQAIGKIAHTEQTIPAVDATCTNGGYTSGVECAVCGYVISAPTATAPISHKFTSYIYNNDANCGQDGTKTASCDYGCGEKQTVTAEGTALSHSWKNADCETPKTCENCGATEGSAKGHSWKNATCTDPKTCTSCGATDGEPRGHNWMDADCYYPKMCMNCFVEEGEALGHNWSADYTSNTTHHWFVCTNGCGETNGKAAHDVSAGTCVCGLGCSHAKTENVPEVPASCTATGMTAGKRCTACQAIVEGCTVIEKLAHTQTAIGAAKEPTCTAEGITAGVKCAVCQTVITEQQSIPAKGHKWVAADCDTSKTCSVCQATEGEALGHKWVDADCDTPKTCSVCKATDGAALGHKWVDADCDTPKTCSVCKATEGAALGHKWVDADCTTPKTCSVCKATEGNALGHKLTQVGAQAATCEAKGWDAYEYCSVCDYTTYNEIAALGHKKVTVPGYAATCTATGLTNGEKCSVCQTVFTEQTTIDKIPHAEVIDSAVEATCTQAGKTQGSHCQSCGEVIVKQTSIPKKDHTIVVTEAIKPTTTSAGKTSGASCSACGEVFVAVKNIPAIKEENKNDNHHNVADGAASAPTVSQGTATQHTPTIKVYTKNNIHTAKNDTLVKFLEAEEAIMMAPSIADIAEGLSDVTVADNKKLSFGDKFDISDVASDAANYDGSYTLTIKIANADKFAALLHYENGAWVVVENAVVDKAAGTITFTVNSLSPFATILAEDTVCEHRSYTTSVTAPTCVASGYTTYICSGCGYTWTGNETAATGNHTFGNDSICDVCGFKKTVNVYANIEEINSWAPPALSDFPPITGTKNLTFDWLAQYGQGTSGQQLRLKLWAVAVGGQRTLAYNINGGTWSDVASGMYERGDIPGAFPGEDIKSANAGFEGYINLSAYAGQNISIGLAVKTASGEYVQIATITNYQVASTQFCAAVDSIENVGVGPVGTVGNPSQNYGALTWNVGQMSDTTLTLKGWMLISGGQQHFAYSVNGGQSWNDPTIKYGTPGNATPYFDAATANAGAGNWNITNATYELNINLAAYAGKAVTVTIARVGANGEVIVFANINVTVGGAQTHTCNASSWTAVGNGQHVGNCSTCGAKLTGNCAAGTGYGSDNNNHWNTCVACGGAMNAEAHTGGIANCQSAAICTVCQKTYGTTNANVHTGTISWTQNDQTHTGKYSCCNATITEAHDGSPCSKCGYSAVPHTCEYINAVKESLLIKAATCNSYAVYYKSCSTCGKASAQTFEDTAGGYNKTNHSGNLEWTKNENTHKQTCSACGGVVVAESAHVWTSSSDTICDLCGQEREKQITDTASAVDSINGESHSGVYTEDQVKELDWTGKSGGNSLTISGWAIADGGQNGLVWRVNGGAWSGTWANNGLGSAEEAVLGAARDNGVANPQAPNGRYKDARIDLSAYKGQTISIEVAVATASGENIVFLKLNNYTVASTAWVANINKIGGVDGFSGSTGSQNFGILNHTHAATLPSTTLEINGWAMIEGGQSNIYWSVDGGRTWNAVTMKSQSNGNDAHIATATEAAGAANWVVTNANFQISMDLSAHAGKTVTVTLARVLAADTSQSVQFAKVTVTVPGSASHVCAQNVASWTPNGNNTHRGFCTTCGVEVQNACASNGSYQSDANGHWEICYGCQGTMVGTTAGHNINTSAPCTEGQKCTICQYVASEPKACTPGAAATCTSAQICTVCQTVLVAKLPHNIVNVDAKAPNCKEVGWDAYEYCKDCDYTTYKELPTADHVRPDKYDCTIGCFCSVCNTQLEAPVANHIPNIDESTCATDKYCTVCNTVIEAVKDHTPNIDAPTCTEDQVCKYCGMIMQANLGGHKEAVEILLAPTCATAGSQRKYCSVCNTGLGLEEIPATGNHVAGPEATCLEPQVCTVCLDYVFVEALGHEYVDHAAQEPNCQQVGWNEYQTCSRCEYTTYVELPKTGHDTTFVPEAPATCGKAGLSAYEYCNDCDYKTEAVVIPATGAHVFDNECGDTDCNNGCGYIRTEFPAQHQGGDATCKDLAICTVCGQKYGELSTVHVYSNVCGDVECDVCGHIRDASELEAHTYDTNCDAECNVCKFVRTDITHTWSEDYITNGDKHWYQCEVCSEKKNEADHAYDNACDADCNECGFTRTPADHTGGKATCIKLAVCAECGVEYGAYAAHVPGAEATCLTAQVCTVCETYVFQNALGHNEIFVAAQAAGCFTDGWSEHVYCDRVGCGYTTKEVIPAYGAHDIVIDEAVDATCLNTGLTQGQHCSRCDEATIPQEETDALGHKYENYVPNGDATCTTDGTKTAICENGCGGSDILPDEGSAIGHSWGDDAEAGWVVVLDPTCTVNGSEERICSHNCGTTETREIKANGHTAKDEWTVIIPAGCESEGSSILECSVCGETLEEKTTDALGHNLVAGESVDATCTDDGYTPYNCSRCDYTENKDIVTATGHVEKVVSGKPATCQEPGYSESTVCDKCGAILIPPVELPANEHVWDEGRITVDATCTAQGEMLYTCSLCQNTKTEIIEMTPHKLSYATSEQQHWKACEDCSYTETREDHSWTDGVCDVCNYVCVHTGGVPTCEVLGVCAYCGSSYGELAEHTEQTVSGTAPNCTDTGLTEGKICAVCGEELLAQNVIDALGHSYTTYVPNGDATCTTDGTKTAYCDNGCGETSKITDEGSATGHNYDGVEWITDVDATCTDNGSKSRACANGCGDKQTETIPFKGHSISADWATKTPATCTDAGIAIKSCTVCFVELETQEIPATGHSWGDDAEAGWIQTAAPGCTTDGEETRVCANGCNTSETRPVAQLGHIESGWTTDYDADCENAGREYIYCERCGDELKSQEIPALGHNYIEVGRDEPTCTEDGTIHYECTNGCYIPKTESIPALNHPTTETLDAVEATCTSTGLTEGKKCTVCQVVLVPQEEVPMKEHVEEEIPAKDATCTATGLTAGKKCSECQAILEPQEIVDMIPHNTVVLPGTEANCLETGIEEATQCTVCNKMFDLRGTEITERIVLSALGHDHQFVETVEAGCTTEGYDIYKCVRCDDSYEDNYTDALGHDYDDNLDTECNRCGETRLPDCDHEYDNACDGVCNICGTTRVPAEHVLDEIEGKDATCTDTGLEGITECTVCGQKFNANGDKIDEQPVIDALGHDYVDHDAQDATCTDIGWNAYQTCKRCDYSTYEEIGALGHTAVEIPAVDATCTQDGKTAGSECSVCGEILVEQGTIPALNHPTKDELPVKAPTCTDTGLEAATKCTLCGQIFDAEGNEIDEQKVVPELGHSTVDVVIAPNCTAQGYTMHICQTCGVETAEADSFVPALGHTNTVWLTTKAPTCAEEGSKYELCVICGERTGQTDTIPTTAHSYKDLVVQTPTCTEAGFTKSICTSCGAETTTQQNALGHVRTEWIVTTAPTCTDKGTKDEICLICGVTVQKDVEVETVEHSYTEAVTAPTCVAGGYTIYTCSVCSESYKGNETAALGHTSGGWVVDNDATCTAAGSKYELCGVCGQKTGKTESIEALGHTESASTTAPTCTADGYTVYTCSVCNATRTETAEGSAIGHVSGGWIIDSEATCTTTGTKHEVCKVCKETITNETIPTTDHNYVTVETESTCTTQGTITITCSECGDSSTTEKELAAHIGGGWIVETDATCTSDGSKYEICQSCGGRTGRTDTIAAKGHNNVTVETESTCTTQGTITTTCTECGETSTANKALADHVSGGWIIESAPDCTTAGSKYEICEACGERTGNTESIAPLGHSYTGVTTKPTCTDGGITTYTCGTCGHSYTDNATEATGHVSGGWVIESEATCTTAGSKYEICGVCGQRLGDSVTVDTLDHSYVAKITAPTCTADGYTTYTCESCGGSYTDNTVNATGHTESDWMIDQTASCENNGSKHTVCTKCGITVNTEVIYAQGHQNVVSVIAPTCTTQGYTITTCTVCGKSESSDYVAASHTSVIDAAVEATCTRPGLTEGEHCSVCGFVMSAQSTIPTLEHTYDSEYDSDCNVCGTERAITGCDHDYGGCTGTVCNNCGHERVAPGHVASIIPGYAATCTDEGLTNGAKCAVCNAPMVEQDTIPATGHKRDIESATCTQNSICVYCGEIQDYAIGHVGQTWETVVEATCTTEGYERELCSCGAETGKYQSTAKAAHVEGNWITDVEATCGTNGSKHTECTACGQVISTETLDATGAHAGGNATCQSAASCEVCGAIYGELGQHTPGAEATCANAQYCTTCAEEIAPKLDHSYVAGDMIVAPTCTVKGEQKYVCSCGAEIIELVDATGTHTPGAAATCTEGQRCTECDQIIANATGHKGGTATCMTQAKCDECGKSYGTVSADNHSYTNACDAYCDECGAFRDVAHNETTIKGEDATCTTDGLTDGVVCEACDKILVKQEIILATGHLFDGDTCTNCGAKRCTKHVYTDDCDATCNNEGCTFEREIAGHYYSSDCDTTCNACGATRTAGAHKYANACDTTCDECGATRTAGDHKYDGSCDAICNNCGFVRSGADHKPGNATCKDKATCTVCGIVCGDVDTTAHVYEGCDKYCNLCGAERNVVHTYKNRYDELYHWQQCATCGAKMSIAAHTFNNDCDTDCSGCKYVREAADHIYDNACDVDCNECDAIRDTEHVYDGDCDAVCNECDNVREVGDHIYDNDCDTTCNACGYVREAEHTYDNACDAECNVCGEAREAAHAYDNACDTTCNTCGDVRETEHSFTESQHNDEGHWLVCSECGKTYEYSDHRYSDNCADTTCDCGYERSEDELVEHTYDGGCDVDCNGCGATREPEHQYSSDCDKTCNVCGDVREISDDDHLFELPCSQKCYFCDFTDETREHSYTHNCDTTCDYACGYVRVPYDHVYSGECDRTCDVCGALREVTSATHTYEFKCSEVCTICGYERTDAAHTVGSGKDRFYFDDAIHWIECKVCGKVTREAEEHRFTYSDLGDGTHTVGCRTCNYTAVVECTYVDGKCSGCKAVEPIEAQVLALPEKSKED